jgi:hypothetical protein
MKNLKSAFALIMVLVVAVCLTGCVSKKASNDEFLKWFNNVTIENAEIGSGVVLTLEMDGSVLEKISEVKDITLIIGDIEYLCTDLPDFNRAKGIVTGTASFTFGGFDEVTTTDYDSLKVILIDTDREEITLTYYPNIK